MSYGPLAHPIGFVYRLADEYGDELLLSFSRYFYRPQSVFDERECFSVSAGDVNEIWLQAEADALKPGWELALNSLVEDRRGRSRHIGMIDFVGQPSMEVVADRVRNMLGRRVFNRITFYDSGRSIHAYVLDLMAPGEWHRFLGRLLLMNQPGAEAMVDTRWIGHRLIGGYSALRWTANSSHYMQIPREIR